MTRCEVLVVGGGPAGSTCAWRLAQQGVDVAVIDRAAFPRDKVCAGWITPAVVRALEFDLAEYATRHTLQPFTGFRTATIGGRPRLTDFGEPVSYGIRRCEFDHYLLARSGARVLPAARVRTVSADAQGWTVNDDIRTSVIVGAGGHFCPVAHAINGAGTETAVIAAQELEFPLRDAECDVEASRPELFFWPDLAGYAWCVRKGSYLNVGAGRLTPSPLPAAVREFLASVRARSWPLPPDAWKGHAYLLYRNSERRVVDRRALLVGDAAGLALAPSGEGILTAIESGLMAADTILEAAGDYSPARLAPYARRLAVRFGPRSNGETGHWPAWAVRSLAGAVLGVPWLRRRVLIEHGFLHSRRPDLMRAA